METIAKIRQELDALQGDALLAACQAYDADTRKSVQQYLERCRRRVGQEKAEAERICAMVSFERQYAQGLIYCGIDEAGRGPLAGPVVAAAVIMPAENPILYINDSKKLSEKKREELYGMIMEQAVSVGVGIASETTIDEINILQATYQAMRHAVATLNPQPQLLINDAVRIPELTVRQVPVIKGDAKCYSIAAASIVAKVTRDRLMREYDRVYPQYGFAENKGYGSASHIDAIHTYGLCPIHRRSFVKNFLDN